MAKKNALQPSKHFLLPRWQCNDLEQFRDRAKEVFPEGSWSIFSVNLELKGWTTTQISLIKNYLRRGWTLS